MCMYVCMYVYMQVYMYVRMYVCLYVFCDVSAFFNKLINYQNALILVELQL